MAYNAVTIYGMEPSSTSIQRRDFVCKFDDVVESFPESFDLSLIARDISFRYTLMCGSEAYV